MALKLGRKPSESLELLDRAGLIEADIRTPMRKLREIEGIRGLMLNREASRHWLTLVGEMGNSKEKAGKPATSLIPATKQPSIASQTKAPGKEHRISPLPIVEQPKKNGANETAKPEPTKPDVQSKPIPPVTGKPNEPANPAQASPTISLERETITDTGSADDLIQRIRQRDGLPSPVEETAEWLSVPYSILDWYVEHNVGITRSKLIVALHRHPETQLEGSNMLKVRKEGKA